MDTNFGLLAGGIQPSAFEAEWFNVDEPSSVGERCQLVSQWWNGYC